MLKGITNCILDDRTRVLPVSNLVTSKSNVQITRVSVQHNRISCRDGGTLKSVIFNMIHIFHTKNRDPQTL